MSLPQTTHTNPDNGKIIDILMITYNRPGYTKKALGALLDSCDQTMRVWVWHNGDHQETLDVVNSFRAHPQFYHFEHCPENKRLREPTNWFWQNSDGAFVCKVDDDCMLPEGWAQTLRDAHDANPKFGVIGCWRFYEEDFVPKLANRKIDTFAGNHQIMRNAWVQGSGYLLRRECQKENGLLGENESFPAYCIRAALSGWQIGWYFPFIHEEHMDDPRSPFCEMKSDEDFMANRPLSAINDNVTSLAQWSARVKHMAMLVQRAHPDPKFHTGWRKKFSNLFTRIKNKMGIGESWRTAK